MLRALKRGPGLRNLQYEMNAYQNIEKQAPMLMSSYLDFCWITRYLIKRGMCLGAVHKLCCLKGGEGEGGQKLLMLLSRKTTKRGEGSKIGDFEKK